MNKIATNKVVVRKTKKSVVPNTPSIPNTQTTKQTLQKTHTHQQAKDLDKPKKGNSTFTINSNLHSLQSADLFNEIKEQMKGIKFIQFPNFKIDSDKMKSELIAAEKHHPFVSKAIKTWKSIPLRSFEGKEGKVGNEGGGKNNSPNPDKFQDTSVMSVCPYIKEILNSLNVPILKARLMRLEPNNLLPEHLDHFQDDRIYRLHIPIVTHENVLFFVENEPKHLPEGTLWYVNVRRFHKVLNKSNIIRVHLVIDVWITDEFIRNMLKPAIEANNFLACNK